MTIRQIFTRHKLITVRAASHKLNIPADTLRHRIYDKRIEAYKPEGCRDWFMREQDIQPVYGRHTKDNKMYKQNRIK